MRPPTQIGTRACTAAGSTTKPPKAKYSPSYSGSVCECGAQGAHRVVAHRAARLELRAEQHELVLERADADAEHEPTAAHQVQRAVALRDREGVVVAEHEHEGREPDPRRARREVAERRERVPVRAAADARDVDRHRDVLAARAEVVPEPLGLDDDLRHLVDPGRLLPTSVRAGSRVTTGVTIPSFMGSGAGGVVWRWVTAYDGGGGGGEPRAIRPSSVRSKVRHSGVRSAAPSTVTVSASSAYATPSP